MNTKGIKFLAVLAVLAMAFAACAVIASADESYASGEATSAKWNAAGGAPTMGPLDFATTGFNYEGSDFDNEDLKNDIVVAYDAETKTYKVTGTLGWNSNSEAGDVLKKLGMPSTDHYALAFLAVKGTGNFQVKIGTIGKLSPVLDKNEDCILSMNKTGSATVKIVGGEYEGTYTIDFSGVALSPSADKNPKVPFVGLKAYNADVKINVDGQYGASATATNKGLGNSVTITEVDKTSSSLYAEYTVYAKLAYSDNLKGKGMDVPAETDLKYALIWQINGLKVYDNYLGVTIPDGMGWNTGDDKKWYHGIATEESDKGANTQETFAFYYKNTDSIAPGTLYLYFGPEDMKTQADAGNAACIKINFEIEQIKKDQIVDNAADAKTKLADDKVTEVELSVGDVDVPLGTDLVVETSKTFIIAANAAGQVSGDITVGKGSDAQKITFTDFNGTVEITKGSVKIYANPWSAGTITLYKDDVVKLSGEITGNVEFVYGSGTSGSAKIIIEKDTALSIAAGKKLTVNSGYISVEMEGTIEGDGTLDVAAAKSLTVKDGAVLSVANVTSAGATKNVVYSGGDINRAKIDKIENWIGKDAASGTWKYNKDNTTLILTNYIGTYNFANIPATITTIELNGDNVVTVAPVIRDIDDSEDYIKNVLFGGAALTKISTDGAGSLGIVMDISEVEGKYLGGFPTAVPEVFTPAVTAIWGGNLEINGVTISIVITGSNTTWTADEKESMYVEGIIAGNLEFFQAPTAISIMGDYDSNDLVGIEATGTLKVTGKIIAVNAATAIYVTGGTTTVKAAAVETKGNMVLVDDSGADPVFKDLEVFNASSIIVNGVFAAKNITISQESELGIKDALIDGTMSNKGLVQFTGKVMVTDAGSIVNYAEMANNGTIGVYGSFSNTGADGAAPGVFTNEGALYIYAMKKNAATAKLAITDDKPTSDTGAVLKQIDITKPYMDYDGSISFKATITVYTKGDDKAIATEFTGKVMPAINGGYTLAMSSATASINVEFDPDKDGGAVIGKQYTVNVTGSVAIDDDNVLYLQANKTTATVADGNDTVKKGGLFVDSGADFDIIKGTINNNATIVVSSSAVSGTVAKDVIIYADATYNGNLVTYIPDVTIKGTFNGDLHAAGKGKVTVNNVVGDIVSHGSVEISASKTMTGDIIAKGDVKIAGSLVGNIITAGSVDIYQMIGKITVDRANTDVTDKTAKFSGAVMVELTYNTLYKATKDATETTLYTAVMDVVGTPKGLTINLAKGSDATATKEVVAGYFTIGATAALDENKTVDMILTKGRILVENVTTLESRYYLTIEAGTTIEVNKSAASLDVKKAGLKVSKDANALFETGSGTPVNYGKVYFIMAFDIESGAYTIYSDVAYALLNCEEGAELTVGESAEIDQNVIVKAGVNIIAEDITLTFKGKDVDMLEGAKITLEGTGKVVFKPTGTNYDDVKKGEAITYYDVTATIVYEDNTVEFKEARFVADSTIQGVAATSTANAKIKTDFEIEAGRAMIASGTGTGTLKLWNDVHDVVREGGADAETFTVSGTFVVGAEAVFDAVKIVDSSEVVKYKEVTAGKYEIKEYVKYATVVGVEGILNLTDDTEVNGSYIGLGKVTVAANKSLTVKSGDAPGVPDEKKIPGNLNLYVVDTTDDANGYLFNFTAPKAGAADLVLKAEKVTISGEKVDAMTIKGTVGGPLAVIKATTDAFLNGLSLYEGTIIYGDDVYVLANSFTNEGGAVGAKTIHMGEAPFADLTYQTVYEDEGYYIYSMFGSVDWDEVTDLDLVIEKNVVINEKLDLSEKNVNIVIDEKATLTINNIVIIGTPATVIGDEGSSIVGKVIIAEDAKAYLVAYADVDLTGAEIVSAVAGNPDAVFSKLDIEDVVYAAIFASNQGPVAANHVILAKADAAIIPAIVGYNFTAWLNYNGDAKAEVGETNAYADARAVYLTVKVKYVPGVDYYMNGSLFNVYDIPTDVPFGSYFTAKISDTTKYQGNPVINGEKTVCVITDMELVASGVTPIPEPEPEPVIGDSGLSLTDILLIVLVILIAIMVVILVLRLNRS